MQGVLIFLLSVGAAVLYGEVHDQITVRICVEYFSVAHPPVWGGTHDPELLAFTWGVIATWWVGAMIGIPLALAARVGKLPTISAGEMVKPIGILLACMALAATAAGVISYLKYRNPPDYLFDPLTSGIPERAQVGFMVDEWVHLASYGAGFLGGVVLIGWVLAKRWRIRNR